MDKFTKSMLRFVDDILLLVGGALIVVGIAQIYPPAAWVVAGLMLVGLAYLIGKVKAKQNRSSDVSE